MLVVVEVKEELVEVLWYPLRMIQIWNNEPSSRGDMRSLFLLFRIYGTMELCEFSLLSSVY